MNIFHNLFPILQTRSANRVIEKKIKSFKDSPEELEYMAEYASLTLEEVNEFYRKSVEQMKSLEDKAKVGIIGITIAVSIIIGLAASQAIFGHFCSLVTPLRILTIVLGSISLLYMSMAGWMSFVVLGEKNQVHQLFPKHMRYTKKKKIAQIALNTELNVCLNIIRYNYVYASYRSILYAVISLSITFVLLAIAGF